MRALDLLVLVRAKLGWVRADPLGSDWAERQYYLCHVALRCGAETCTASLDAIQAMLEEDGIDLGGGGFRSPLDEPVPEDDDGCAPQWLLDITDEPGYAGANTRRLAWLDHRIHLEENPHAVQS